MANDKWYLPLSGSKTPKYEVRLVGGTSAVAPMYASFFIVVNQLRQKNNLKPVGFVNDILYELQSNNGNLFTDITKGKNTAGYTASVNYDMATGLGTPNFDIILEKLVNYNETNKNENENENKTNKNETNKNSNNDIDKNVSFIDEWELDGSQIFNSRKKSTLDILNELSKKTKKEKKSTRKRVKNVETLIKDNNYDIFEFINSGNKNNQVCQENLGEKTNEYSVYDRAKLYDDYKTSLEGYNSKKKYSKICPDCGIEKVLIYSEGIYACMKCGDVENCIIENEITNYKEPMVEKPTFPYKRKNHFCEWTTNKVRIITLYIIKNNVNYF